MVAAICIYKCEAYYVTIDAHSEECFFERAKAGTKLGFTFEVTDGGFLDIDIMIKDPDGGILHKEDRASSGKYTIEANKDGKYTYCFGNKMSTVTPKVVMFSLEIGEPHKGKVEQDKLDAMVQELGSSVISLKHDLDYMAVRDRLHRQINEATNSRVITWTFFELIILLIVSVGQVYYLKRFFEVRRVL